MICSKKWNFCMAMTATVLCFCLWPVPLPAAETAQSLKARDLVKMSLDDLMNTTVVTASRTETPLSKVTKSISVISGQDIAEAHQNYLPELVDNVPGVYVKRNGGPGRLTIINMRGAEPQYTQLQYNGIPLKDAADTQNTFHSFFPDLWFGSDIDHIEVLRGTNSTLYGSQAMGGVINILSKKWEQGTVLEAASEFGSRDTVSANARAAYGTDKYYVNLAPVYFETDGEKNGGTQDYDYEKKGMSAGAGVRFTENASLEFNALLSDSETPMNDTFPALDAEGNLVKNQASEFQYSEGKYWLTSMVWNHKFSDKWDYTLKGSYSETSREYFYSTTSGDRSEFDGDTTYIEMQHNFYPTDRFNFTIGLDYEKSTYDNQEPKDSYSGIYDSLTFSYDWASWDAFSMLRFMFLDDALLVNAGGRYNHHEEFGSETVWEISSSYTFKNTGTRIRGHVGTGYRTPSLYEINGGYLFMGQLVKVGNPDLEPEKSTSYELGADQFFMDNKLNIGLTWFKMDFEDIVVYDMMEGRYNNASEAETSGLEGYMYYNPNKYIRLGLAYTYADPEYTNSVTNTTARKENFPRNKASLTASLYPAEKLTANFRVNWQDEKIVPLYDTNYNRVRWEEDSSVTVDASVTYALNKNCDFWVRAENLFDEDYTEGGYTMPGLWTFAGVRLKF